MTESKTPADFFRQLMNQSKPLSAANGYAEAFWKSQAAVAAQMKTFTDRWYARRQDAAAAAADCCARIAKGGTPADAATAWADWSKGEIERLGADAREQAELTASLSSKALDALSSSRPASRPAAEADSKSSAKALQKTSKKTPSARRPSGPRAANGRGDRPHA